MTELYVFAGAFVWLAASGWSLRVLTEDVVDNDTLAAMFFLCLLLAPFTVGVALAEKVWPRFGKS